MVGISRHIRDRISYDSANARKVRDSRQQNKMLDKRTRSHKTKRTLSGKHTDTNTHTETHIHTQAHTHRNTHTKHPTTPTNHQPNEITKIYLKTSVDGSPHAQKQEQQRNENQLVLHLRTSVCVCVCEGVRVCVCWTASLCLMCLCVVCVCVSVCELRQARNSPQRKLRREISPQKERVSSRQKVNVLRGSLSWIGYCSAHT